MQARLLINGVLLFVCAGLCLFLVYGPDRDAPARLSGIDPDTIDRIVIRRQGKPEVGFVERQGRWLMVVPVPIAANPDRISAMLGLLNTGSYTRLEGAAVEPGRLGLDPEGVTLVLNGYEFAFGGTDGIDSRRYVLFDGTVHLLDDRLYPQLTSPYYFFVSRRLIPDGEGIGAIEYGGSGYRLDEGVWVSDGAAGADDIAATVNAWREAEAVSVSASSGFEADGRVRITLAAEVMEFFVAGGDGEFVLVRPERGVAYKMSAADRERLLPE